MVLMDAVPKTPEGLTSMVDTWEEQADRVLRASDRLAPYDLDQEEDASAAFELIKDDHNSLDFWAMVVGAGCHDLRDKLNDAETLGEAVVSAVRVATSWAMFVFVRDLEEHAWTGYNQNQLIYGIAQAGASTPAEAQAIAALEPIFKGLGEDVLHTWVEAGVDIGPRIGVSDVDEALLKALARYHLGLFERRRSEQQQESENRARVWTLIFGGFAAGATATGAVLAVLKATEVF
jgi:hypothetical protein